MRDDALSVIVCGAGDAVAAPKYLSQLRQHSPAPLRVLLTHSAMRFLQPETVRWYADEVFTAADAGLNPTEFALRSACVIVLPSTANMLAAAAYGLAGTPAQTALLSAPGPIVFFPVMNQRMWQREPVRRNVATLRADGHIVVDPPEGEVYEIWRRETTFGIALPAADQVVKIVMHRLESGDG